MKNPKVLTMKNIFHCKKKGRRNVELGDDVLLQKVDDFLIVHLF